jgi:hypothetical protein
MKVLYGLVLMLWALASSAQTGALRTYEYVNWVQNDQVEIIGVPTYPGDYVELKLVGPAENNGVVSFNYSDPWDDATLMGRVGPPLSVDDSNSLAVFRTYASDLGIMHIYVIVGVRGVLYTTSVEVIAAQPRE